MDQNRFSLPAGVVIVLLGGLFLAAAAQVIYVTVPQHFVQKLEQVGSNPDR